MTQSVWHRDDIARIAATLMALSPSEDFAAGVVALAHAVGADVQLPRRRDPLPVVVTIDSGREVAR